MRRLLVLTTILALSGISQAQGRLFWQTYGSIDEHPGGCGCAWNANQEYFVPRQCHAGRYGLFSPCKTSCTDSPACKYQHPLYPGYCTTLGPCHYCWRNHVYRCYCGCCGLHPYKCNGVTAHWCGPLRYGCGGCCGHCLHHHGRRGHCGHGGCRHGNCGGCQHCGGYPCEYPATWAYQQPAPNLEPAGMQVLGTVPVQGDELLASMGVNLDQPPTPADFNQSTEGVVLPLLGIPQ